MRIAAAAIVLVSAVLAGGAGAMAVGFSGAPFVIAESADGRQGEFRLANDAGGAFAALYSVGGVSDFHIFAQRFDARGRAKGKPVEIFDNADRSGDERAIPNGWLPLAGDRALAAFWTPRESGDRNEAGGLRGQIIDGRKLEGKRFSIDRTAPAASAFMSHTLEPMNEGRGLALWPSSAPFCDCTSGRFIGSDGRLAERVIDLGDGDLSHVSPYRRGFVATFIRFGQGRQVTFAQKYDGEGRKAGGRRVLVEGPVRELFTTETIGLADGSLLVGTHEETDGRWNVVAQTFDGGWTAKSKRRTLRKNIVSGLLSAMLPLPAGGFVSAVHVRDGADGVALELTRYDAKVKSVGASARMSLGADDEVSQVLALENGQALVVVRRGAKVIGQLIKL